jgi:hypothetical protein
LITEYLTNVGTMLQNGHFKKAKQAAKESKAAFSAFKRWLISAVEVHRPISAKERPSRQWPCGYGCGNGQRDGNSWTVNIGTAHPAIEALVGPPERRSLPVAYHKNAIVQKLVEIEIPTRTVSFMSRPLSRLDPSPRRSSTDCLSLTDVRLAPQAAQKRTFPNRRFVPGADLSRWLCDASSTWQAQGISGQETEYFSPEPDAKLQNQWGVCLEDAADYDAIGKHVVVAVAPLAGWARSWCKFEDQIIFIHFPIPASVPLVLA